MLANSANAVNPAMAAACNDFLIVPHFAAVTKHREDVLAGNVRAVVLIVLKATLLAAETLRKHPCPRQDSNLLTGHPSLRQSVREPKGDTAR